MRTRHFNTLVIFFLLLLSASVFSQYGKIYDGPTDPAGDILAERSGFMNGNNVLLFFKNTTELSDCCNKGYWVSRWPNDYSGSKMHDGIHVLFGARVYVENDSIPVDDPAIIRTRNDLDTLYYCQTSYREFMDMNDDRTIEWGLYPVFGYFNVASPTPAMSNKPDSWPSNGWPARGSERKWPGVWNGRFGLGITKADLETFFVANDAQDQEFLGPEDKTKYYPRPGVRIGDIDPTVSIQRGFPWGGLGLRVEVRGFQWKHPEAADCIFWEYTIANISDYNLPEMYFGYQIDNAVGGEEYDYGNTSADDVAYYDTELEMCFSWDLDGEMIGGGGIPGCMGIAFLESPGVDSDLIDNDQDGVIDERRDNLAGAFVSPMTGVHNLTNWNRFRGIDNPADTSTIKWHFEGDEDQDWTDGYDANENGRYDEDENAGDDVGTDGSGPWDLDYPGPDANGTECNHKPDLNPGIGSEPNFGYTDIGESDMLGLTTFKYVLEWGSGKPHQADADESLWYWLTEEEPKFHEFQGNPQNFVEQFASGVFTLYQGSTERISMSELHALERLHEQTAPPFSAPALFSLKKTVQAIYESDYQFAQPPVMPTLKAIPGDGKVVLTWDNIAERFTREPLLGNINDFEGYKLYKSTDPFMSDNNIITDGFGTRTAIKPVYQCDLIDGKNGFTDFGYRNGMGYYLGDDSGIRNYYIDNNVENGRTYYYVLVAYDYGVDNNDVQVGPSENTFTIDVAADESIVDITRNVAVVTPHQYAAGYVPPEITDLDYHNSFGKNTITPKVVVESYLKDGHEYMVKFGVDTLGFTRFLSHGLAYRNNSIEIWDTTVDSLVYYENGNNFVGSNFAFYRNEAEFWQVAEGYLFDTKKELQSSQFEGMSISYRVPALSPVIDSLNSGWITGNARMQLCIPQNELVRFFPYDFDIIFTDTNVKMDNDTLTTASGIVDDSLHQIFSSDILFEQPFPFYVQCTTQLADSIDHFYPEIIVNDINKNKQFDWTTDRVLVGYVNHFGRLKGRWAGLSFVFDFRNATDESELPKPGDCYHVTFNRGFTADDKITYKVNVSNQVDEKQLNESMEKIRLVPNPYIVTNTMEKAVGNWEKTQGRRIMFTHIPAQCTIRIFSISGVLIDEFEVNNSVATRVNEWDTNSNAQGIAYWDLLTKDGLEVAAGYYIYHIESKITGKQKMGKFAIIK